MLLPVAQAVWFSSFLFLLIGWGPVGQSCFSDSWTRQQKFLTTTWGTTIFCTHIHKPWNCCFPYIKPHYLVLVWYPLVVSTLAPCTLSGPIVLMASETRDSLDKGSSSELINGPGRGATVWKWGLFFRESKCEAQRSWSSLYKHIRNTFGVNQNILFAFYCIL